MMKPQTILIQTMKQNMIMIPQNKLNWNATIIPQIKLTWNMIISPNIVNLQRILYLLEPNMHLIIFQIMSAIYPMFQQTSHLQVIQKLFISFHIMILCHIFLHHIVSLHPLLHTQMSQRITNKHICLGIESRPWTLNQMHYTRMELGPQLTCHHMSSLLGTNGFSR